MDCAQTRNQLGLLIDGELPPAEAEALDAHVTACPDCARELAELRDVIARLEFAAGPADVKAPVAIWAGIERRLYRPARRGAHRRKPLRRRVIAFLRRPIAAAASLALLLGASATIAIWVNQSAQTVQAASVDYSVLLDGLSGDVDAAVERFLKHYGAEAIPAESAAVAAPALDFRLPPEVLGAYRREAVYRLRFGAADGVAARYRSGTEPLVVFFHPPVENTRLGVHAESHCHVAGREGQRVEVGPWRLMHFTDATTCHCLLSKLSSEADQLAVFQAIAPRFVNGGAEPR